MDISENIRQVLEQQVQPVLQSHGGSAELTGFENGTVFVALHGACAGCPSADIGTREMIETTLRAAVPEVQRVKLEQQIDPEMLRLARELLAHGGEK